MASSYPKGWAIYDIVHHLQSFVMSKWYLPTQKSGSFVKSKWYLPTKNGGLEMTVHHLQSFVMRKWYLPTQKGGLEMTLCRYYQSVSSY